MARTATFWSICITSTATTDDGAAGAVLRLPRVTVQLPIFNEQYVVERLLESICKLEYPRELLDIQLLDDSTDETVEVARGLVERYRRAGQPDIVYHPPHQPRGLQGGRAGRRAEDGEGRVHRHLRRRLYSAPDWIFCCGDPSLHRSQTSGWCRRAGRTSTATTRS
jgi:cellulose synthase/poly-beta-1,6-N-acetylglucosamine synthase-like glycosyltransferase